MNVKKKAIKKKAVVDNKYCVACGVCVNNCPFGAIKVVNGVVAKVDEAKCVGCGKCEKACPASVIEIIKKEEEVK
jgi:ferredoxin